MSSKTIRLAGLALLALSVPCFAQTPGPIAPEATAESHLTDSVTSYEAGDFEGSLLSATEALEMLNNMSAIAYNNICTAQIRLAEYELAAEACRKALERSPTYERAKNNLEWTYQIVAEQNPTAGAYLNLSEVRYRRGALEGSIAAAERALELDPGSAIAYNNLCAAHAADGKWSQALAECEKALAIDPDYELAKGNLAWVEAGQAEVSE